MTKRILCATAVLLAVSAFAAQAQNAGEGESCAAYASWAAPVALKSAPADYDVPVAQLMLGQAATVALHPVEETTFLVEPERFPDPGVQAGLVGFTAPVEGTYRVSLGMGAWVDLVNGDELVPSAAFGHGPGCEGVRKVVEFPLQPGDYAIQISGNPEPTIGVMVHRLSPVAE